MAAAELALDGAGTEESCIGSVSAFRYWISEEAKAAGVFLESPRYGDAGFDLRASAAVLIPAGEQVLVPTGLHCAIPVGWVGIIKDRSSVALRGLHTHAGVIDASYRGEVKILIANRSGAPFSVVIGLKIAQMVIIPHLMSGTEASAYSDLGESERGQGGFGSTGR